MSPGRSAWLLLALLLAGCARPEPPPAPAEPEPKRIGLNPVAAPTPEPEQLSFDAAALGLPFEVRQLPAIDATDTNSESPLAVRPPALCFILGNAASPADGTNPANSLMVTSAGAWSALERAPVHPGDPIANLAARLNDRITPEIERLERLPDRDLPGGVLHARADIVEFESGVGVRFLSAHAEEVKPLVNGDLVYNFVGLTWDGRYVVSLVLALRSTLLPDVLEPVLDDRRAAFALEAEAYARELSAALEAAPDSGFRPSLAEIDRFVRSITVR